MVFSLVVVAVSLAQVPAAGAAVAVIPANPTPLGQRLEAKLAEALAAEGVPLQPVTALRPDDGRACETNRRCFGLLGQVAGAHAVVRLEVATVAGDVAVLVEAIESATGKVIREESFAVLAAVVEAQLAERLKPLTARVKAALPAPKPIVLVAEPEPPPVALTAPPVAPRSSGVPPWATGGGAIVFAGASAGLFALSASARSCLQGPAVDGRPTVCVPHAQAAGVQQRADIGAIAGTAAGAVALGLATTALIQYLAN